MHAICRDAEDIQGTGDGSGKRNFIKILYRYKYPRYIYLQAALLLHSAAPFLTESTFLPKERVLHFLTESPRSSFGSSIFFKQFNEFRWRPRRLILYQIERCKNAQNARALQRYVKYV